MLKPNGFLHVSLITELPPFPQPLSLRASSVFSHTATATATRGRGRTRSPSALIRTSATEKGSVQGPVHPPEAQAGLLSPLFRSDETDFSFPALWHLHRHLPYQFQDNSAFPFHLLEL